MVWNVASFIVEVYLGARQLSSTKSVCHKNFGFSFINVTNLTIHGIYIEGCLASQSEGYVYALKLTSSSNVLIHNVSISHSQSIGLYLQNVHVSLS